MLDELCLLFCIFFPVVPVFFCQPQLQLTIFLRSFRMPYQIIPEMSLIPITAVPYMDMISLSCKTLFRVSFHEHQMRWGIFGFILAVIFQFF